MAALARLVGWVEDATIAIVAVALVAVVCLQVTSRYAIGTYVSLAWTDEVARALMTWLTFLGAAVVERRREQIQVTIITDMLAPRARALAALASDVISGAFLVLVLVTAVETLRADGDSTMVSLPVPLALVSASLTIGALLMLGHTVARILAALAGRGAPAR